MTETHDSETPKMFYRSHDWNTPSGEVRAWVMLNMWWKITSRQTGKKPGFKYEKACNEPQTGCSQALEREWQKNEGDTRQGKGYSGGKGIKVSVASSLRLYLHWESVMKSEGEWEAGWSDGQKDKGWVTSSTHGIISHTVCWALDMRYYHPKYLQWVSTVHLD